MSSPPRARRRTVASVLFRGGTYVALFLVLSPALWLLGGILAHAVSHWHWSVLWTPFKQDASGGLAGPILGTLVLMGGVLVVAGTVGVLTGVHLAEMARARRSGRPGGELLRTASDVLSGFPSIVLGFVFFEALVVGLHWGYSLVPAVLVLSVMVVPYIAKSTEVALRQVPDNYREGAEALGMSQGYTLRKIVLRSGAPGIVTGLLIALAIAGGETAPLIYTAGFAGSWTGAFIHGHGFPYLTYVVWEYWDYPNKQANVLSYDAALILVVMVLVLLVAARLIIARTQRHAEGRAA
ncbi:MAG TPA: ABC transporter permease subunit [Acidimicrobiales bacterium]|nr:ABC transporter permease subunit [Acidimicrobiales bacterium]